MQAKVSVRKKFQFNYEIQIIWSLDREYTI